MQHTGSGTITHAAESAARVSLANAYAWVCKQAEAFMSSDADVQQRANSAPNEALDRQVVQHVADVVLRRLKSDLQGSALWMDLVARHAKAGTLRTPHAHLASLLERFIATHLRLSDAQKVEVWVKRLASSGQTAAIVTELVNTRATIVAHANRCAALEAENKALTAQIESERLDAKVKAAQAQTQLNDVINRFMWSGQGQIIGFQAAPSPAAVRGTLPTVPVFVMPRPVVTGSFAGAAAK
jgi:hypothetical protein